MIDWIEQIPFTETRNYVERVLENMEDYKNRLAGKDHAADHHGRSLRPGFAARPARIGRAGIRPGSGQTEIKLDPI